LKARDIEKGDIKKGDVKKEILKEFLRMNFSLFTLTRHDNIYPVGFITL